MNYGTDAKMIAPFFIVQNEYVFDGTLPELTATVPVFKRQSSMASLPLSAISSRLNLGTLNLNSFGGMNIDSLSFAQNTPMGYQLYINFRDSSVNIDAQWDQWPPLTCTTDACWQTERVTLGDIPADDVLMSIAKEFADAHGIDLSHYGEPEEDKAWKTEYDRTTDKANAYIPDSLQVVFPLMIDGKTVLDQQGMPSGISFSVHVKQKKVMSVYGLMDRTYAKSDYPAVTDAAAVKTFLSRVDNYGPMPMDSMPKGTKVQTQKIILGEPTVGLSVYYSYQANKREELVIPSLIFPV
ncbi:hypothetical protein EXS70_02905, partial [Candidatus Peribacteria bacterium]|nr:hypothetical protein [Candidatus Peribacteria bacterium]